MREHTIKTIDQDFEARPTPVKTKTSRMEPAGLSKREPLPMPEPVPLANELKEVLPVSTEVQQDTQTLKKASESIEDSGRDSKSKRKKAAKKAKQKASKSEEQKQQPKAEEVTTPDVHSLLGIDLDLKEEASDTLIDANASQRQESRIEEKPESSLRPNEADYSSQETAKVDLQEDDESLPEVSLLDVMGQTGIEDTPLQNTVQDQGDVPETVAIFNEPNTPIEEEAPETVANFKSEAAPETVANFPDSTPNSADNGLRTEAQPIPEHRAKEAQQPSAKRVETQAVTAQQKKKWLVLALLGSGAALVVGGLVFG